MTSIPRTVLSALLLSASACTPHLPEPDSGASPAASPAPASGAPAPPARATVLRGARLVDGRGGPPIEDAVVVIEGDRIRAAGPAASVAVPAGAGVVELAGKTVVPGLVADHAHVGMVDGTSAGHGAGRSCVDA